MYLHITLNSGRTMHGGMTQSIIEVYDVSLGVRHPAKVMMTTPIL